LHLLIDLPLGIQSSSMVLMKNSEFEHLGQEMNARLPSTNLNLSVIQYRR
jgi:hypothetical protein